MMRLNWRESLCILVFAIHVTNGCFRPPSRRPPPPTPPPPTPPPPSPPASTGVCSGQTSGALVPNPDDPTCRTFVQCLVGGPSAPMTCGPGTRFDASCACCNFESQVTCGWSPPPSPPTAAPPTRPPPPTAAPPPTQPPTQAPTPAPTPGMKCFQKLAQMSFNAFAALKAKLKLTHGVSFNQNEYSKSSREYGWNTLRHDLETWSIAQAYRRVTDLI